ncbi:alpha/beta hydrolase [Caulobacter flavus]|uniref:alpha/beta hydrolase n=1 Tax=Caulobacter flavus TaxID=1679497 RepID=UPI0023EA6417|nr:alpha/beta hydrolase [Caulobacter flavus]
MARGASYGGHPRQKLDVYAPSQGEAGEWPVLAFFYGGAWNSGRRADYGWAARALAAQGFLVVVPDYRLYPEVRYPAFLEDAALAVRWTTEHAAALGGDPARLSLAGHSAGAYIAAMLALDPSWLASAGVAPGAVKAFAGLSGPYAFLPLDGPITTRTFGHVENLPATQPTSFARADAPAAFLATGEGDTTVRPRNTRKLAKALREAGATVEEQVYPGLDHAAPLLALSRSFRRKAPVLVRVTDFLKVQTG